MDAKEAARFEQERRAINKTRVGDDKLSAMSNYSTQQLIDTAATGQVLTVADTKTQ